MFIVIFFDEKNYVFLLLPFLHICPLSLLGMIKCDEIYE